MTALLALSFTLPFDHFFFLPDLELAVAAADYTRVEFKLYDFTHNGKLASGDKCDIGTQCDPRLRGYVDLDQPDAAWPGPLKDLNKWALIYEGMDIKEKAVLGKIVSRDVCTGSYHKANLRVQADEVDPSRVDKMDQFMCMSGRTVARSERAAEWSTPQNCDSHYAAGQNKLKFSWRAYPITARECGQTNL